jgi:hypothetical protein
VVLAVRYSDAMAERELSWPPIAIGLVLAASGALLLRRERRVLLAKRAGTRVPLPSWWI